jgi:hypothetical protein
VDVTDAASAVLSLLSAAPAAIQTRMQDAKPRFRPAFRVEPDGDYYADPLDGFAVRGDAGLVYSEQAFHYLLDVERTRAESAQRPFLLMRIASNDAEGGLNPRRAMRPERLFPIVRQCLRETDFVGWYRLGAVVGAALTHDGDRGTKHSSGVVRARIVKALDSALPSDVVSRLRLHLYEVVGDDERRIE